MSIDLILIGAGGFAVEIATYISDIVEFACGIERHPENQKLVVTDIVSHRSERYEDICDLLKTRPKFHREITSAEEVKNKFIINCVGDPVARSRILSELPPDHFNYYSLLHPTSYVSATAKIGAGAIVCPFVFIGPYAKVSNNALINVNSIIGHDAEVGQSAVLSPGSRVNGHAFCGEASFLGAGAMLIPKARLGNYSKLSAGSVLTKNVGDGFLMHGNPAAGRQMIRLPNNTQCG